MDVVEKHWGKPGSRFCSGSLVATFGGTTVIHHSSPFGFLIRPTADDCHDSYLASFSACIDRASCAQQLYLCKSSNCEGPEKHLNIVIIAVAYTIYSLYLKVLGPLLRALYVFKICPKRSWRFCWPSWRWDEWCWERRAHRHGLSPSEFCAPMPPCLVDEPPVERKLCLFTSGQLQIDVSYRSCNWTTEQIWTVLEVWTLQSLGLIVQQKYATIYTDRQRLRMCGSFVEWGIVPYQSSPKACDKWGQNLWFFLKRLKGSSAGSKALHESVTSW